jgi:hypothetical protein
MEWEFSPEDVVKGHADYGLANFRHDLAEELRLNLGATDEVQQTSSFNLIYDLCYALATSKDFDAFLNAYVYDPTTVQFLREVKPMMLGNVEMLGAILQRQIMDRVEAGMALEQAVEDVARWHVSVVN